MHGTMAVGFTATSSVARNAFHGISVREARPGSLASLRRRTSRGTICSGSSQLQPDEDFSLFTRYQGVFRKLPLVVGAAGIALTLVNRIASGVAPVADASSAQSRADVVLIGMCAVLGLTGLQWLALAPKEVQPVPPGGTDLEWLTPDLPSPAAEEIRWAFDALSSSSRCIALVIFRGGRCIAHLGVGAEEAHPGAAVPGKLATAAIASQKGNYLANLTLYPGRFEFFEYLPRGTQGVALAPCGDTGCLVAGVDAVRGFSKTDQAWLSLLADKLDSTLQDTMEAKLPQTEAKSAETNA